jgi:hypothetical protein
MKNSQQFFTGTKQHWMPSPPTTIHHSPLTTHLMVQSRALTSKRQYAELKHALRIRKIFQFIFQMK